MFEFYRNKKILITGHTGFKGAWLCKMLLIAGADVTGYALEPPTQPNLFDILSLGKQINSITGDIRDLGRMQAVFGEFQPEIVIHMAAQPIVRESYESPVYTYDVNVMGTVNVLECIRHCRSVMSFVNVTTDKVYRNNEWEWGYRENDVLGGYDPYSNSKSCSELVTESYKNSFLTERNVAVSTARAGNVIGGGDFARDRIIPDCVKAVMDNKSIVIRNPYSIRPYQHVLEPLSAYLLIARLQYEDGEKAGNYNIGPGNHDCLTTGELVSAFCDTWNARTGKTLNWENKYDGGPHEANFLKLDCSKAGMKLGWRPVWDIYSAIEKVVEWTDVYLQGGNVLQIMEGQIGEYMEKTKAADLNAYS